MQFKIRVARNNDLKALEDFERENRLEKSAEYFIKQLELQANGNREVVLGVLDGVLVGYCVYNRAPKYGFFRSMGFPEIQDLNVGKTYRQRGFATLMIQFCEDSARLENLTHMGISVALLKDFGAAQRLYFKLGYMPDGNGVTYDRHAVSFGEFRAIDDDLCLMMVKDLKA